MTRTCSSSPRHACRRRDRARPAAAPAARAARSANLRHQIYLMEGALARAVNFGAASLNQEIPRGDARHDGAGRRVRRARLPSRRLRRLLRRRSAGAAPEHDVEPADDARSGSIRAPPTRWRRCAASSSTTSGPERAAPKAALRRLEAQIRPFGTPRARPERRPGVAGGRHRRPAGGHRPGARRPTVNPQLLDDPNKAYTDAVVQGADRRDGRLLAADGVVAAAGRGT